jgi:hypothetical protein
MSSATLTINADPMGSGHGGGGAIGEWTLLALAGLGVARALRARGTRLVRFRLTD